MKLRIVENINHLSIKTYVVEREIKPLFGSKRWKIIPWNILGDDYVIVGSYRTLKEAEATVEHIINFFKQTPQSKIIKEYEL